MECNVYINNLQNKFSRYFDIERNINISGTEIDMFAKYFERCARTLITQKDVIDAYENNEICFIKCYEALSLEKVYEFENFLKNAVARYVKPHKEHMSTYITGVIVCKDEIDSECVKEIKKFKYSKAFKFFLHGWCEVRFVAVDLLNNSVITNKQGKSVKKVYQITP
ncbi:hypothetical protein FDN13_11470 [Caloramator sp. E03]|uniref:hypothetical protein n=1 Tax=Caloramator sp. E03 TaxID=2576307 RepID=UPI0011102745|nr:hypothetical protein [Caloramator sp. E03]QCX34270.1 hypothetical protein FDN13_11470 [Caloramator sp. E03]